MKVGTIEEKIVGTIERLIVGIIVGIMKHIVGVTEYATQTYRNVD